MNNNCHPVSRNAIAQLEQQGCYSPDWSKVSICAESDMTVIRNCRFYGTVVIGLIESKSDREGLFNSVIRDCEIGNHAYINSVAGELCNVNIGNNVVIDNVERIRMIQGSNLGIGTEVAVLDETGSRKVAIYPGLTAQTAYLAALYPEATRSKLAHKVEASLKEIDRYARIGNGVVIRDCGEIVNVGIDGGVRIEGAERLVNGLLIRSAVNESFTYVGHAVNAENFIIENGRVDSGTIIRNCYVGEGVELDKGLTAHDSLFFCNSVCEAGEICASLIGPFTVTMHKSTLLIGGLYSFANAGSGTNFSNHMYKLGPMHWGILQRGVKTSSGSYLMWGAKIGAFSLLMGEHKNHPDTSSLPFSYLFADGKGNTIVTPGTMLKSCGLYRDGDKWPKRDKRRVYGMSMNDNVVTDIFNPVTVGAMMEGYKLLSELIKTEPNDDGHYSWNGITISRRAATRGLGYYRMGILRYFKTVFDRECNTRHKEKESFAVEQWIDVCGQPVSKSTLQTALECTDIVSMQECLNNAFACYRKDEYEWVESRLNNGWRESLRTADAEIARLEKLIEADKEFYLESLKAQQYQ